MVTFNFLDERVHLPLVEGEFFSLFLLPLLAEGAIYLPHLADLLMPQAKEKYDLLLEKGLWTRGTPQYPKKNNIATFHLDPGCQRFGGFCMEAGLANQDDIDLTVVKWQHEEHQLEASTPPITTREWVNQKKVSFDYIISPISTREVDSKFK